MPIIIKPKVEDYIKVALKGIYIGKSFKRSLWMQRLTLPVIAMLLVLLAKPIVPLNVLIAAVISAVWIYFIPEPFKKNIRKKIERAFLAKASTDSSFLQEYKIDKIEGGLEAFRGENRFIVLFDNMSEYNVEDDYIYILSQDKEFDFLIPSHAFKTKEEFEGFKEALDRQIQIAIRK